MALNVRCVAVLRSFSHYAFPFTYVDGSSVQDSSTLRTMEMHNEFLCAVLARKKKNCAVPGRTNFYHLLTSVMSLCVNFEYEINNIKYLQWLKFFIYL